MRPRYRVGGLAAGHAEAAGGDRDPEAAAGAGGDLFTEPYLLTGRGGRAGASVSPVLLRYTQGIEQGKAGYAAAIGVLLAIGVMVVSLVHRFLLERS
jgi:multiple sugar transport system permease protein